MLVFNSNHLFSSLLPHRTQLFSFLHQLTLQSAPVRYNFLELRLESVLLLLKHDPEFIPSLLEIRSLFLLQPLFMVC